MAAAEVKNQVIDTIQQLAGGAFEGPETQLRSGRWVRGWPVPPYRVLYRRGKDVFDVVRIYDQRRRPITK